MSELPRITRALRAHTDLDIPRTFEPEDNAAAPLPVQPASGPSFDYKSLADITDYIRQNESNYHEILQCMLELQEAAHVITGEQPIELVEDATVLCLRMFLDRDAVMLADLSQLKQLFGGTTYAAASKACEIVKTIVEMLNETTKEYIKAEIKDKTESTILWGESIQCNYERFTPVRVPLAKMTQKLGAASDFAANFSMKYKGETKKEKKPEKGSAKHDAAPSKYGKEWLQSSLREYFRNSPDLAHICQSLLNIIHSRRTNDEVQSEMFDLLGFDKFDYIQELLEHRQEIVNNLLSQPKEKIRTEGQ